VLSLLIIRIWNYFRGYVIIKIEGLTLEKFINLAIAKGIYLWDIIRCDYTTLEAKVGIKGFKELKEVVSRVGCKVSIKDKKGYPFLLHKFKYRKMLAFGAIVAIGVVFFMTSFIWSIDIIGNERIKDEDIIKYLSNLKVKTGVLKYNIDTSEIRKKFLIDIDSFSYVHAEIRGTKLIIDLKERDITSVAIDDDTPCNIVAKKKAVIDKVIAKNGKNLVEKGDIVKEGQVIISGIIQDERMENPLLVHSEGTVFGITNYTEIIEEPIVKTIKEETGRIHTSKEIKIGNKGLQLMSGEIPFKDYIEERESKKVIKSNNFDLPLETIIHIYKEVTIKKVTQNVDSLKKMSSVRGVQLIMEKLSKDTQVISKDVTYSIEDNILITKVSVEVKEEIGRKEKIQSFKED